MENKYIYQKCGLIMQAINRRHTVALVYLIQPLSHPWISDGLIELKRIGTTFLFHSEIAYDSYDILFRKDEVELYNIDIKDIYGK